MNPSTVPAAELEQLVKEADFGGREPPGRVGIFLALVAALWSLFQLLYASPLPFLIGTGIFNDTEARAIHLAFSVFLAFAAFPAFKRSSRTVVPFADWVLAVVVRFVPRICLCFISNSPRDPGNSPRWIFGWA